MLPAMEKLEREDPKRLAAFLAVANQAHYIPCENSPFYEGPKENDPAKRGLPFYRKLVAFYEDILTLLPEDEQVVLTIFSSHAYANQRIEIAKQALNCEKSQVFRSRNKALDHAHQLLTGHDDYDAANPLKIGDTKGTKWGHTGAKDRATL